MDAGIENGLPVQGVGNLAQADHALGGQKDDDGAYVPVFRICITFSHPDNYSTSMVVLQTSIRSRDKNIHPWPGRLHWRRITAIMPFTSQRTGKTK